MSAVALEPLLHKSYRQNPRFRPRSLKTKHFSLSCSSNKRLSNSSSTFCNFKTPIVHSAKATSTDTAFLETQENETSSDTFFKETFHLKRIQKVEGKISVRLRRGDDKEKWQLSVGCNLHGNWILHWGVNYIDDVGSEWDQPPLEMRPAGSVPIKDYAIETPLTKSSLDLEGEMLHEVKIDFNPDSEIAAINFVLKDEETGSWYQHRGRDFKVPFLDYLHHGSNVVGAKRGFGIWPGALGQLSNILIKTEVSSPKGQDGGSEISGSDMQSRRFEGFYEEYAIVKEVPVDNTLSISVNKCPETAKNNVYLETDIPEDVVVHWGVCKGTDKKWYIPPGPYPPETKAFKNKALRTQLQFKEDGLGSWGSFTLDEEFIGFLFVLKLSDNSWLNDKGSDFYVPLPSSGNLPASSPPQVSGEETDQRAYTDEIINEIRNLVSDISLEKSRKAKTKEAQESILQEIEKLAAEAYSIFRSSIPTFTEATVAELETQKPPAKFCSGTGTGFEILCQGFNWESHKSGRWYMELYEKAEELSSLGFTVVWLPPPTESVSPEGYMPKDLYNLNSRYGNIEELKALVKRFHEVGIIVLGDVVLNHRCAHYQNKNGVWNIFGGRLNWDDCAIVADDPHFQGRGNKSSGDNFHAAPNIDHSQDFVRKDIKEWLCWLREEIGYDGWRLDFVRGFWGGYVKDYLDASEPYFAVGEYWDSLGYTYGEMDHNQDAHRQRIIDWINAASGTAGAFDVTTKGILHSGHWRFPSGKEMQGYAYILTHPGTPSVFYDHIFSHYKSEILALISLRNRNKIHCRSTVKIAKAESDVYAAIIDEKVAVKIGPGHFEPPSGSQNWSFAIEGKDYKVWEAS
ncbi:Alpha-amylase, C-terminal beta-sheet [Dillenia turbinata]|uniref:alpha-amylase n=1 Tax=Dillenia turbinata TaxID=194707 RepID=A0AAN8VK44_9MAGN